MHKQGREGKKERARASESERCREREREGERERERERGRERERERERARIPTHTRRHTHIHKFAHIIALSLCKQRWSAGVRNQTGHPEIDFARAYSRRVGMAAGTKGRHL